MCSEAAENRHRFNADIAHTLDRTGGLLPRIAALEAELSILRSRDHDAEYIIGKEQEKVAALESEVEALTADLASWGDRLAALEAENAALRLALEGRTRICAVCGRDAREALGESGEVTPR